MNGRENKKQPFFRTLSEWKWWKKKKLVFHTQRVGKSVIWEIPIWCHFQEL